MGIMRLFRAAIVALAMPSAAAGQGPANPNPARLQLSAWLAAYAGDDWDAYLRFLKTNFVTPPGRGFQDQAFRERNGGYEPKKIERETSTTVTGLTQEQGGDGFAGVVLEVEPEGTHRIGKLEVNLRAFSI